MVTRLHVDDASTDGNHLAGPFVAHDGGRGQLPVAVEHVPVGAADARRAELHEHGSRPRLSNLDLADLELAASLEMNCRLCAHGQTPFRVVAW